MAAPILVITGPPGTGKTTVAAAVAARYELSAVVHGDSFFDAIVSGFVSPHLPASSEQNDRITEITATTAAGYAAGGWNTILEGVFGPWYLPAIERVATPRPLIPTGPRTPTPSFGHATVRRDDAVNGGLVRAAVRSIR